MICYLCPLLLYWIIFYVILTSFLWLLKTQICKTDIDVTFTVTALLLLCSLVIWDVYLQGGMINWNRFFPSLRHQRNANYQDNHQSGHEAPAPAEVSEEQVNISMSQHGLG